jgi:hypothetical protein
LSLTFSTLSMCPEAAAMNCKTFFDASVFPEPDSPRWRNEEMIWR